MLEVDPNTVPAGLELTTANNPLPVALGAGEEYVRGDFGYADEEHPTPTPTATPSHPTVVLVSNFAAFEEGGRVIVQWETGSEVGTVGYNLLRASGTGGDYRKVNDRPLAALLFSPQGGAYRFTDAGAKPGASYTYMLEEIESSGAARTYGPFAVTIAAAAKSASPSKASASGSGAAPASNQAISATPTPTRSLATAAPTAAGPGGTGDRIRISVKENGVYSLSDGQIASLLALPAPTVREMIGAGQLRLSNGAYATAYAPAPGNAGILFYGAGKESIYTDENVYWLGPGEGLTMAHLAGSAPTAQDANPTFSDTVHAEQDLSALTTLFDDPLADYWVWAYVIAGDPNTGTRTFTVTAPNPAAGTATLTVRLKGGSNSAPPASPDHHARVSLNGTVLGDCRWDGTEAHDATFSFAQTALKDGANTVTVTGLLDTGVTYSLFHVDSFDLAYRRYYRASGGALLCTGDTNARVSVSGFPTSDITLLDVSAPAAPKVVDGTAIDGAAGNYGVRFIPASPTARYFAFCGGAVRAPAGVTAVSGSPLKSTGHRADYVVITADELKGAAQSLADYRAGRGLETMVVTFRGIVDEFNGGISSPEAIRTFLSYARSRWAKAPRYVVLAGAGTYDYRNRLGYGGNLVPPLMTAGCGGLVASDTILGDVEGDDGVPEIAVGRLPAATSSQLQTLVNKIIAYESAVPDPWLSRVTILADNPDSAGDFSADSDDILSLIPADLLVDEVHLAGVTVGAARQRLLADLNNGSVLLNYFGHGGLNQVAQEGLLTTGDVAGLSNGVRLPFVTAMTCAMGNFSVPGYDCLAEALVLKSAGGAIGVWCPAGLSTDAGAKALDEAFYHAAFWGDNDGYILGDIALDAAATYTAQGNPSSTIGLYNILGDPALALRLEGDSSRAADSDGDGLSDEDEAARGTDPSKIDTDGDGFSDYLEVVSGSDPLRADSRPVSFRINFQPAGFKIPAGYIPDAGERYTIGRPRGWR